MLFRNTKFRVVLPDGIFRITEILSDKAKGHSRSEEPCRKGIPEPVWMWMMGELLAVVLQQNFSPFQHSNDSRFPIGRVGRNLSGSAPKEISSQFYRKFFESPRQITQSGNVSRYGNVNEVEFSGSLGFLGTAIDRMMKRWTVEWNQLMFFEFPGVAKSQPGIVECHGEGQDFRRHLACRFVDVIQLCIRVGFLLFDDMGSAHVFRSGPIVGQPFFLDAELQIPPKEPNENTLCRVFELSHGQRLSRFQLSIVEGIFVLPGIFEVAPKLFGVGLLNEVDFPVAGKGDQPKNQQGRHPHLVIFGKAIQKSLHRFDERNFNRVTVGNRNHDGWRCREAAPLGPLVGNLVSLVPFSLAGTLRPDVELGIEKRSFARDRTVALPLAGRFGGVRFIDPKIFGIGFLAFSVSAGTGRFMSAEQLQGVGCVCDVT
jgi:hypothetical protein